jgi:hypothetical protein
MGGEFFILTYAVGLLPLAFGLYVTIVGSVYLNSFSKQPIKGSTARLLGCLCMLVGVAYYITITWAWSFYDR